MFSIQRLMGEPGEFLPLLEASAERPYRGVGWEEAIDRFRNISSAIFRVVFRSS